MGNIFSDLAECAKAGYTPAQVKEIIQLSQGIAKDAKEPDTNQAKEPAQPDPEKAEEEPSKPEVNPDDAADDRETKIKKLEEQVKNLQKMNASKDLSAENKPDDGFGDFVRSYM